MPGVNLLPGDIYIDSEDDLREVIKILLKVKKGLNNNLNIKNSLKGMLYHFSGLNERAITGEYVF